MTRLKRSALIVVFLCVTCTSGCNPEDACPSGSPEAAIRDKLECQFALGRAAYAREDYKQAAEHWQKVVEMRPKSDYDKIIVAVAHGTLGYLFYYGKGVNIDRKRSVQLYRIAVRLGDLESRQHLGFAFSDKTNDFYDPVIAYAWYHSVERHYKPVLEEENAKRVLQRARDEMARIKALISDDEVKIAEEKSAAIE